VPAVRLWTGPDRRSSVGAVTLPRNSRAGGFGNDAANVRAARRTLVDLVTRLGVAGLGATRHLPGLGATIDQHAAAIRDDLGEAGRPPSTVVLAGYAEQLRAASGYLDWPPPPPGVEHWRHADLVTIRLLAVCQLAIAP
jgi:hypothetical protein